MKNIILFTISFFLIAATTLKAGNPIPSYNTPVYGNATFQESSSNPGAASNQDEKRDMNVTNGGGNSYCPVTSVITVYVYRLDLKKSYGPFFVPEGETISVRIDSKAWGVFVGSNRPTTVSVWTNEL